MPRAFGNPLSFHYCGNVPKGWVRFFFSSRKYKRLRGPRLGIPVCRSPSAAAGTAQPRVSPRRAEPERSWGHRRRNVEKRLLGVVSFRPGNGADPEPRGHRPRRSPAAPPDSPSAGRDEENTGPLIFGYGDNFRLLLPWTRLEKEHEATPTPV